MLKYCRNCGKELVLTREKTCSNCEAKPTKATAFCRYCGIGTRAQDTQCPTCGAALRPIANFVRLLNEKNPKLVRLGIILNLVIVMALISMFTVFSLPKQITKPIKTAASDVIMESTGYTALPLYSIAVVPPTIPQVNDQWHAHNIEEVLTPEGIAVNTTCQLTVFAVYKNTAIEDITGKVVYKSNNEWVATVNATGFVKAVGSGSTIITVIYIAAPGSANLSSPSIGKVPITLSANVPVNVH